MSPIRLFAPTARHTLRSISIFSSIFASTSTNTKPTMSSPPSYRIQSYQPSNPSGPFPYSTKDLTPMDTSTDTEFYSIPRFVTHIDDNAILSLRQYYDAFLPRKGRILDFCSSWVSHYPPSIEEAVDAGDLVVMGTGMNADELAKNAFLNVKGEKRWVVQDLNRDPDVRLPETVGSEGEKGLDASTCVVSVDYLTKPVDVLRSIREKTREGGMVHLVISNRCFPTKAVGRWLRVSEEKRLEMVGDYLWWSGWRGIEIVQVVSPGQWLRDPLWVVRGRNVKETEGDKSEL